MIRFTLNPRYADTLRAFGLDNYQNISTTQLGEVLEANQKRDTRRLTLGSEVFYLKRTKTEKISSAIEHMLLGHIPHSKPYIEMQHIQFLQHANINTMEVVACGEHTQFGIPRGGFILSRQVPGMEGEAHFQQADETQQLKLCKAFGELTGQLHSKGFFASTRLKDVFCQYDANNNISFTLIDRETRNPHPKKFTLARAAKSLAASFKRQSRDGSSYTAAQQQAFISGYHHTIQLNNTISQQQLLAAINTASNKA
ncbi:hypothetical protein NO559_02335 [Dasania sp. GY-MA-18]|uniref:Uncharacterized protein n=1 Tax=Dasania phycosphaerae TaxID=2950436 RepID=A0A9J6RHT5_9GAMM|nr:MULTISPECIES: lipopolysaccharide kinase InaA family protein [Dasania]MCR8921591.1 hypothetical protein [Dasania sp. GY-MA-18]MCZ0864019.1 hypothetical protein [Dasania phycosphaerae]MCZ0867747.1 hypothetical protein [Dasania phycosphaerae]